MLKFLFRKSAQAEAVNQRKSLENLLANLNDILRDMPEKPLVIVDANSGEITLDLPDQMPDEALALPAPDAEAKAA